MIKGGTILAWHRYMLLLLIKLFLNQWYLLCVRASVCACIYIKIIKSKNIALSLACLHSYLPLNKVISSATFELKNKIYWWELRYFRLKKSIPSLAPVCYKQEEWRPWLGYLLSLPSLSLPLFLIYKNALQATLHILSQGVSLT